jgi:peptide/nickel transport system substrate-binding protein
VRRFDGAVVLVLVILLVGLAAAAAAPSLTPAATSTPGPAPTPAAGHVEGVLGRPSSITPLTARTQVDRDLVALLFRGLVRAGPGSTMLPDLAERWSVEAKGARWTFHLRDDAFWHDGVPVTSADVVFTVRSLQDPGYAGPLAATWARVSVAAPDARTVRFELGDPVGSFLEATALPLLPAHILDGFPVDSLADHDFARHPTGNGAFVLVDLDADRAILEPVMPQVDDPAVPLDDPIAGVPSRAPRLARLELRFYDTAEELEAAFAAGAVDAAGDLPPAAAVALAKSTPGARALRYPATTLTAIAFNLRSPTGPFSDQRARRALLAAVDRRALIDELLGGAGSRASTPIPPSSWAYDAKAAPAVAFNRQAAVKGLKDAGWRRPDKAWIAPGAAKPFALTLLAPDAAANPIANAVAVDVAAAWTSLGLKTQVEDLAPGEFVERLRAGDYTAAIVDVNIGLDPDLYPLLASSQVREGGANVSGLQNGALDRALEAARAPGSEAVRMKSYRDLQQLLGTLQPMPAILFRDSVYVAGPRLRGPIPRPVADPGGRFWDVVRWDTSGR